MPRKSVVRLTDRPGMTLDVYRGRKTTVQPQQQISQLLLSGEAALPFLFYFLPSQLGYFFLLQIICTTRSKVNSWSCFLEGFC